MLSIDRRGHLIPATVQFKLRKVFCLRCRWASVPVPLLWQGLQQERRSEDAHPHTHPGKCSCSLTPPHLPAERRPKPVDVLDSDLVSGDDNVFMKSLPQFPSLNHLAGHCRLVANSSDMTCYIWMTLMSLSFQQILSPTSTKIVYFFFFQKSLFLSVPWTTLLSFASSFSSRLVMSAINWD